MVKICEGLLQWLSSKESACNAGDTVSIPGWERSPGGENGNPQYSCLKNPVDRGAWQAAVQRVVKSWIRLSTHTQTHTQICEDLYGGESVKVLVTYSFLTLCDPMDCSQNTRPEY